MSCDEPVRPKRRAAWALLGLVWLACTSAPVISEPPAAPGVEAWKGLFDSGERWRERNTDVSTEYFERASRAAADLPKDDPRVVRTEQRLGEGRRRQGRLDEAQGLLDRALASWRPVADRDPVLMAELLESRGLLCVMQARLPEAEADLAEALELRVRTSGARGPETAEAKVNLAEVQRRLGKVDEAEKNLLDAGLIYGEHGTRYAMRIATIQNNLGLLYQQTGRLDEAESQLRQAILLARRVQEKDNPNLAIFSRGLADLYLRTGRIEQAGKLYQWSFDTLERTLGPANLETKLSQDRLEAFHARYGSTDAGSTAR